MKKNYIYIVMSRDRGLCGCRLKKSDAEKLKDDSEHDEEMAGGRPSVWIEKTEIKYEPMTTQEFISYLRGEKSVSTQCECNWCDKPLKNGGCFAEGKYWHMDCLIEYIKKEK